MEVIEGLSILICGNEYGRNTDANLQGPTLKRVNLTARKVCHSNLYSETHCELFFTFPIGGVSSVPRPLERRLWGFSDQQNVTQTLIDWHFVLSGSRRKVVMGETMDVLINATEQSPDTAHTYIN